MALCCPYNCSNKNIQITELDHPPQPPIEVQKGCRYCLDNLDCEWLKLANEHRRAAGLSLLTESDLELIITEFETQANSSIRNGEISKTRRHSAYLFFCIMTNCSINCGRTGNRAKITGKRQKCNNKSLKSLEDNSVCDVCRSPNGEDGNELVFCDGCDICVHQHCYGITSIDEGDWYCLPCKVSFIPF